MKDWFSNIKKYLKEKNRFIIQNPHSFEQKFALTITKRNTILIVTFLLLIFSFLVYLIISFTSLKNFIPGYPSKGSELYRLDKENQAKINKIYEQNRARELWINNLQNILKEKDSIFFSDIKDTLIKDSSFDYKTVVFERIEEDSLLRKKVKLNSQNNYILYQLLSEAMNFRLPISTKFTTVENGDIKEIRFSKKGKAKVRASLDGTVLNSSENSLILHHRNNLLTVYKNMEDVKGVVGEKISQGDRIGVSRDSVFIFQLWYNGKTVSGEILKGFD